jgi:hypothetical protein
LLEHKIKNRVGAKDATLKRLVSIQTLLEGPKARNSRTCHLNPAFGWKDSTKNHKNVTDLKSRKKAKKLSCWPSIQRIDQMLFLLKKSATSEMALKKTGLQVTDKGDIGPTAIKGNSLS